MFYYWSPLRTFERRFPLIIIINHAGPRCGEKPCRYVRGALLRAAALHPHERTGGGEESYRRSGAESAGTAAAAAASGAAAASRAAQGAVSGGRSRELPVRLYRRGGQHGQLHGPDQELGTVSVPVLRAEAGSRHEAAFSAERICDLQ